MRRRNARKAVQRRHQARRPRLRRRTGTRSSPTRRRRARRTCSSSSTTTPAGRRGRRTAGGSTCRRWTGWPTNGLTYSQWHTTALCSPTRSTLPDRAQPPLRTASPRSRSPRPASPATTRTSRRRTRRWRNVLRDAGWSTFWVGKNHNVPIDEWTMGASKKNWPLGQGYDRFYGFIGGETNNWYPDLAEDNHYIDQPYLPEDGYHLSKDLADQALRFIRDSKQTEPDKPWYLWFCPGANHAPHHAPAGVHRQVQGHVRRRLRGLPRVGAAADDRARHPARGHRADADQPDARGHLHADRRGAAVGRRCPTTRRRLFCRMAEVYAGFSEYTDAQVGRIVDYLEESGPARQHDHLLLRRQRRVRRGQPERLGQRGQVLQRLPRRPSRRT